MAWTDLTTEQQQKVAEFFRDFRAAMGAFVDGLRTMDELVTTYQQNVAPVWSTINTDDEIPDDNGLANSGVMTKDDWQPQISWANNAQSDLYGAGGVSSYAWPSAETLLEWAVLDVGPTNI